MSDIITNPTQFYEKFLDHSLDITSVIPMTYGKTQSVRILYKTKKDFIEEHNVSNVVISLWTTSAAR
ncbi:hypothetical protein Ddc_21677 [Ditylenchus destructor]|nr:hypothetical protein Ddc_21677 [Ditylenchus destructor]